MALQGAISELSQNASTLVETATEAFTGTATEVLTETAPEILKETAGEAVKEVVTSENAAGLLSSLLEGGSSVLSGAWDGISDGASYVYNNPVEAASGALKTVSEPVGEFIADNAFALGVTVGLGFATLGGYKAYQNRDKIAEGFSGLAAKFGRRNNAQTSNTKQEPTSIASSSNDGNGDSANDGVTPTEERRSPSPRPNRSNGSGSSSD